MFNIVFTRTRSLLNTEKEKRMEREKAEVNERKLWRRREWKKKQERNMLTGRTEGEE
jgi:hypothetical protein